MAVVRATRLARGSLRAAALLLSLSCAAPGALADTPRAVIEEIARCSQATDEAARLRCFDAAARRARAVLAEPSAPVDVPMSGDPVERFGKPAPRAQELPSISAKATEFARTARGKALFVLDNGQVWRQLDSDGTEVLAPEARTFNVMIERSAVGGYNLTMEGRNGLIKVARVR